MLRLQNGKFDSPDRLFTVRLAAGAPLAPWRWLSDVRVALTL